ncbi:MAG: protein phosphatase 2C domain-containing protein, partial [Armatimonadota bacterium]|nr:protein phosphatase 2C domain-containing protein [Armatimonadota bacterium]
SLLALQALSAGILSQVAGVCGERPLPALDPAKALEEAMRKANRAVKQAADAEPPLKGMGTTLTAGLLEGGVLFLGQVGDSRCYRIRGGIMEQQTADHSVVGELVRLGKLTTEEARTHPRRNIITRAVGVEDEVEVDISAFAVEENDLYLFCSDGLWELVPDTRIAQLLTANSIPHAEERAWLQETTGQLLQAALAAGGDDNITVLLALVNERDIHPEALRNAQAVARTRVESAAPETADLKKTLRYRLQEWQQ